MDKIIEILNKINAEVIKTELICFIQDEGTDCTVDEFVDYMLEDLSRGDSEVDN